MQRGKRKEGKKKVDEKRSNVENHITKN